MWYYQLESVAERRARKERDIKALFQYLTIKEGMPFMETYEAVLTWSFLFVVYHTRPPERSPDKLGGEVP